MDGISTICNECYPLQAVLVTEPIRDIREAAVSIDKTNLHPKNVVSAYADLLAAINEKDEPKPLTILSQALPESALPFPRLTIRHSLAIFLLHADYIEQRDIIEDAYLYLDNFISDKEYKLFSSLQESINNKELSTRSSGETILQIPNAMKKLQTITQSVQERKTKSTQELSSLRRIMGISDDINESENRVTNNPEYDEGQELKLQL